MDPHGLRPAAERHVVELARSSGLLIDTLARLPRRGPRPAKCDATTCCLLHTTRRRIFVLGRIAESLSAHISNHVKGIAFYDLLRRRKSATTTYHARSPGARLKTYNSTIHSTQSTACTVLATRVGTRRTPRSQKDKDLCLQSQERSFSGRKL